MLVSVASPTRRISTRASGQFLLVAIEIFGERTPRNSTIIFRHATYAATCVSSSGFASKPLRLKPRSAVRTCCGDTVFSVLRNLDSIVRTGRVPRQSAPVGEPELLNVAVTAVICLPQLAIRPFLRPQLVSKLASILVFDLKGCCKDFLSNNLQPLFDTLRAMNAKTEIENIVHLNKLDCFPECGPHSWGRNVVFIIVQQ